VNQGEEGPYALREGEVIRLMEKTKKPQQRLKHMPREKKERKNNKAEKEDRPTRCIQRKRQFVQCRSDKGKHENGDKEQNARAQINSLLLDSDSIQSTDNIC
jgi:hypothetical protein